MSDTDDPQRLARIQEVVTALIERRIAISLGDLDGSLAAWRKGEIGALEATFGSVVFHNVNVATLADELFDVFVDLWRVRLLFAAERQPGCILPFDTVIHSVAA